MTAPEPAWVITEALRWFAAQQEKATERRAKWAEQDNLAMRYLYDGEIQGWDGATAYLTGLAQGAGILPIVTAEDQR